MLVIGSITKTHLSKICLIRIALAWILQGTLQYVPAMRSEGFSASGNLFKTTPGIPGVQGMWLIPFVHSSTLPCTGLHPSSNALSCPQKEEGAKIIFTEKE